MALFAALLLVYPIARAQAPSERWVGTWATAPVGRPQNPQPPGPVFPPFMPSACPAPPPPARPAATPPPGQTFSPLPFSQFTNQTLRQIIHTSIGGAKARVVLTNAYGTDAVTIGAAAIAIRDKDSGVKNGSSHALTFSGRPTISIPANAVAYSDPVDLAVPPMADLAVDIYVPGTTNTPSPLTMHVGALQTSYISETGNHAGKTTLPTVGTTASWFLLSRVDVATADGVGAVVAFGDSITDGSRSTADTNNRWPDHLARRMLSAAPPLAFGVLNAGIGGNRVLNEGTYGAGINALGRFEQDVLSHAGVTHVIVLEGINDIGNARQNTTPSADDVIAGHKQLIARAHARGLKIFGATLTPFWGAPYYTEVGERKRQAVNEWIRTSKAYDGVVDFDRATRDPNDPKKIQAAFDPCDHLHFNDAGYRAMAEAIDLALFTPNKRATSNNGR